jgi:hypothetical protein
LSQILLNYEFVWSGIVPQSVEGPSVNFDAPQQFMARELESQPEATSASKQIEYFRL